MNDGEGRGGPSVRLKAVALSLFIARAFAPDPCAARVAADQPSREQRDILIHPARDACARKPDTGIVVCGERRDSGRYRIPSELREGDRGLPTGDVQARLGPSMFCRQAGNVPCGKAAIPIFSVKDGKAQIGPDLSH